MLTGTYLCFYVHLADLSSVRYKTSTWNEIKELIKSNYVIIPSLPNKSPKNMTRNDRWEMKLFLGGQKTARWNGSEINNLTCNPVQSSWRYLTFHPTLNRKLFFVFFLLLAFILQFAQYFLVTFNFFTKLELLRIPPPPRLWVNPHPVWFSVIFERSQSKIWNDILFWHFKLLLFFSR